MTIQKSNKKKYDNTVNAQHDYGIVDFSYQ
jgi:hypothetical protein